MYRPTSLTKWDISLSSLIIRCCPALQIPPLSSTCNICSYCRFLAEAPHLVFMAMLRFHVWLLVHTSSYSRRRVNGNLFIIIWQWWLPRNVTLSWPHFSSCGPRGKKTATITASGISRVLMLQLASIYVQWQQCGFPGFQENISLYMRLPLHGVVDVIHWFNFIISVQAFI